MFSIVYIIIGSVVAAGIVGQMCQEMLSENADVIFENQLLQDDDGFIVEALSHHHEDIEPFKLDSIFVLFIAFVVIGTALAYYLENFDIVTSV